MPQLLPGPFAPIRLVCCISLRHLYLKLHRVPQRLKVNVIVRRSEYRGLVGKVAVVRIVQGVLNEVSNKHFHTFRRCIVIFEIIRCYDVVIDMVTGGFFEIDI